MSAVVVLACGCANGSPLVIVTDQGGPKLEHPQVVVVTFADDPNRAARETLSQWLVTSDWLDAVGAEYGIGAGSILGMVERTEAAPDTMTDAEIQSLIAAGIADASVAAPVDDALYLVFFPAHTSISGPVGAAPGTTCLSFLGYHSEGEAAGVRFAYAVIPTCDHLVMPPTPEQYVEYTTSHELIEAATDPFRTSAPGFRTPSSDRNGWSALGGELADLCSEPPLYTIEHGYVLTRVWSNRVATERSGDPCVPAPPPPPYYYGVTITPETWRAVSPGETVTFSVTGFSFGPVEDWALLVTPPGGSPAMAALSATQLNDGETATLTVHVPDTATHGWSATMFVYSHVAATEAHESPVVVYVP